MQRIENTACDSLLLVNFVNDEIHWPFLSPMSVLSSSMSFSSSTINVNLNSTNHSVQKITFCIIRLYSYFWMHLEGYIRRLFDVLLTFVKITLLATKKRRSNQMRGDSICFGSYDNTCDWNFKQNIIIAKESSYSFIRYNLVRIQWLNSL